MDVSSALGIKNKQDLQDLKIKLMTRAANIGLWDMLVTDPEDPSNPDNPFNFSDEFRYLLGFEGEHDFPNVFASQVNCMHPEDREQVLAVYTAHVQDTSGQTPYDLTYRMIKKNGEIGYFRDVGETQRDAQGRAILVSGALVDKTHDYEQRLEIERQMRLVEQSAQEAVTANQAKSNFLSTMSHEIRTPMNAILGVAEIQLQKELDDENRDMYSQIHRSGELLLNIINDILDLSKIEAGKLEVNNSTYEVASLLADTAQLNLLRAAKDMVDFELIVDEATPMELIGDELRIKQILNNILSNAFKYTEAGIVSLKVDYTPDNAGETGEITLTVSDTGQGMSESQVALLFDEYSRFTDPNRPYIEGTGLGMNITYNLVNLMNGHIDIVSTPGHGTTVIIRLSQGLCDAAPIGEAGAASLREFREQGAGSEYRYKITQEPMPYGKVLVVDDMESNLFVARGLMQPYKLGIETVNSGLAAIDKIAKGASYDIVFMDYMMPEMDGITATNRIRAMGYDKPIIALTANALIGQEKKFLSNGFEAFVSKPIDIRELNRVLIQFIRDRAPKEAVEKARAEAAQASKGKVREVETTTQTQEVVKFFLMDARRSLTVLESFVASGEQISDELRQSYIVHVHGMKTALGNMKQHNLAKIADSLESLAKQGELEAVHNQTPEFINQLTAVVQTLTPTEINDTQDDAQAMAWLGEQGKLILAACEEYDDLAVEDCLDAINQRSWSGEISDWLSELAEQLLMGDFTEIASRVSSKLNL